MRIHSLLNLLRPIIVGAIIVSFVVLILSKTTAQNATNEFGSGTKLLKEYFLPIQANTAVDQGKIVINGNDCLSVNGTACAGNDVDQKLGYGPLIASVPEVLISVAELVSVRFFVSEESTAASLVPRMLMVTEVAVPWAFT